MMPMKLVLDNVRRMIREPDFAKYRIESMLNKDKKINFEKVDSIIRKQFGDAPYMVGGIKLSCENAISSQSWHTLAIEAYDLMWCDKYYQWNNASLLDIPEFRYSNKYWMEGAYECDEVQIEKDDVIIDCGANMGLFSLMGIQRGASKSYAFEPVEYIRRELRENIELNNMQDAIEIVPYATYDADKILKFETCNENVGSGKIDINGNIAVNAKRLDTWWDENDKPHIDFIKADIEGSERNMLYGARKLIEKCAPKIAICTYHLPDDKVVLHNIIKSINKDYKVVYHEKKMFAWV